MSLALAALAVTAPASSNLPGSGNHARWLLTLPRDPAPNPVPGADTYAFENHIAFWFGMALCASQSYPEQLSTCQPDSDSNIVNPQVSSQHAGSAYLELQFYPPGWAPFPSGTSCDGTHWCAAMNVWSYYLDPVTGQFLNSGCQAQVGSAELDNYAFVQLNGVPYTFHPMYSTSSLQTRSTWTAFPYNVAYSDETGDFQLCSQVDTTTGECTGLQGAPGDQEPADADDYYCFAPSQATRDPIGGCAAANYGFDGTSYTNDWPNGQPNRGTPEMFTSPLTGPHFNVNYQQTALAAPLPFNEAGSGNQDCNIYTDTGCTQLPITDEGTPAQFYPYFYTTRIDRCTWGEGTDIPRLTVNDFGKLNQYGSYDSGVYYTGTGGKPYTYSSVFLQIYNHNLCQAP